VLGSRSMTGTGWFRRYYADTLFHTSTGQSVPQGQDQTTRPLLSEWLHLRRRRGLHPGAEGANLAFCGRLSVKFIKGLDSTPDVQPGERSPLGITGDFINYIAIHIARHAVRRLPRQYLPRNGGRAEVIKRRPVLKPPSFQSKVPRCRGSGRTPFVRRFLLLGPMFV